MRRVTFPLLTALLLCMGAAQADSSPTAQSASTGSADTRVPGIPARTFLTSAAQEDVARALALAPAGQPVAVSVETPRLIAAQALLIIRLRKLNPPRAARFLALTLSAVNDTQYLSQSSGRLVNADLAAYIAGMRVLNALYPEATMTMQDSMQNLLAAQNAATAQATAALAESVAGHVLHFARADGADAPHPLTLSSGDGTWQPLTAQKPLEPGWGAVTPIAFTSQTLPQVAPPPAWNSAQFAQDRLNFKTTQQNLSVADIQLGNYWAAGPGTVTPGGMWLETALNLSRAAALNGPDTARVLATTAVAEHGAFITCWHAKFQYNVARPQGWMNSQYPGWTPNIATPPFPSYPSGHATVSGAAAYVLAAAFPDHAAQLVKDAQAAAYSRVVGGIHWTVDGLAGLDAGQRVAEGLLKTP